MPGVCLGAAVIGTVEAVVPAFARVPLVGHVFRAQGAPQLVLGLVALVVMAMRGQRIVAGDVRGDTL
jgi:hypothetical protein